MTITRDVTAHAATWQHEGMVRTLVGNLVTTLVGRASVGNVRRVNPTGHRITLLHY